jgi:hypothetical protein
VSIVRLAARTQAPRPGSNAVFHAALTGSDRDGVCARRIISVSAALCIRRAAMTSKPAALAAVPPADY